MPFLRVVRDKRGYETTYLLHWYREGARQRSRILYVFRGPGSARVGRDPLDPDLMRELEALHPDVEFDWPAMREQRQIIDSVPEVRRRRPRREDRSGDRADADADLDTVEPGQTESGTSPLPAGSASLGGLPAIPAAIDGATPAEQMAFLQHWYPIVMERIPRRTADPVRQAALTALATRLNPEVWTDADQMTAGLQGAAEALERLSRVLSRRRRRSRRRATAGESPAEGGGEHGSDDETGPAPAGGTGTPESPD